MQTQQNDKPSSDWQLVNRTRKATPQGKTRGDSAQHGRGGFTQQGTGGRGADKGLKPQAPGHAASERGSKPGVSATESPPMTPPLSCFGSATMTPKKYPPPPSAEIAPTASTTLLRSVHGPVRHLCPPSPTYSAGFNESSSLPATPPSLSPDTSATIKSSSSSDRLSDTEIKGLLDAANIELAKLPASEDHGMLAYSCSSALITASTIAHRVTRNNNKLTYYELRAHLTHFREILTDVLVHVGFRGAMSREPEYHEAMQAGRAEFVAHVKGEAALLWEFERFLTTPLTPTPPGAAAAAAATTGSPTPEFVDGHALLLILGGGQSRGVARLNIKILNDNVHKVSIRQVSVIARKLKEQGLLKGFGISIDAGQSKGSSSANVTKPVKPVESILSVAACGAFLSTLNNILCVGDITCLTPAELARFAIPPSSASHRAPRATDNSESTIEFATYLRELQNTKAYQSDVYIEKVVEWAAEVHQLMLRRWEIREWEGGIFTKWRTGLEELKAEKEVDKKQMQADRDVEKEHMKLEQKEERLKITKQWEVFQKEKGEFKARMTKQWELLQKEQGELKARMTKHWELLQKEKGEFKAKMREQWELLQKQKGEFKARMTEQSELLDKERKEFQARMEQMQVDRDAEKKQMQADRDAEKEEMKKEREDEMLKRDNEEKGKLEARIEQMQAERIAEKVAMKKKREDEMLKRENEEKGKLEAKIEQMEADRVAEKAAMKKEQEAEMLKRDKDMDAKMEVWKAELLKQMVQMMTAGATQAQV